MPQVIGTVTEDSGSVVTNYSDTVTNSVQTFTFSTQQDGMTFINRGNAIVTLTVNGKSNNIPPNGTIRLNCEFTSFDVTRIQAGSHPFEINSFKLKNDVRDVEGFASQLADNATLKDNLSIDLTDKRFGAKGDGTTNDSASLLSAIAALNGKPGNILIPSTNSFYVFSSDITIPAGVNLIGNGVTIQPMGLITLTGSNIVSGICFDGKWSSKGLKVTGAGVHIFNNTFKNIKQSSANITDAILVDNTKNIFIHHNIFDGIKPYDNSATGTNSAVSRAIRVTNDCSNIIIESNTFDNMEGYSDSDYVHVNNLNNIIPSSIFPFNQGIFGYYAEAPVIIRNNIFKHAKCKSDIKIQSSGVTVEDNKIYVDTRFDQDTFHNAIRVYNSVNSTIRNNKIFIESTYFSKPVLIQYCQDLEVAGNEINNKVDPVVSSALCYQIETSDLINIKNNKVDMPAFGTVFYLSGVKNTQIHNNTVKAKTNAANTVQITHMRNSGAGETIDGVTVKGNNIYTKDGNITAEFYHYSSIANVEYVENTVRVAQGFFTFYQHDNVKIIRNDMKVKIANPITLNTGTGTKNGLHVEGNHFDNSLYTTGNFILIRCFTTVTGLKVIGNNITTLPSAYLFLYNTGSTLSTEVTYVPGNITADVDSGTTANRNPYNKRIGFPYYDTTLGKMIWWSGSAWKDATGTAV